MAQQLVFIVGLSFLCIGIVSCGAPLKNADEVEAMFSETRELSDKVTTLCNALNARTEAPTLNNLRNQNEMCSNPATNYANYRDLGVDEGLEFSSVSSSSDVSSGIQDDDALFSVQTTSELFLNRSILSLAITLLNSLEKKAKGTVEDNKGQSESKDKKFQIDFIGKPVFNKKEISFSMEFRMASSRAQNGQVDIDNRFIVSGRLLENESIAIDVQTKEPGDVKNTIIRDGKIMIFIVPHAGDVYMEIATDMNYHSFGVDQVMKESILSTLGTGMKSLPELVLDAKN